MHMKNIKGSIQYNDLLHAVSSTEIFNWTIARSNTISSGISVLLYTLFLYGLHSMKAVM